MNTLGAPNGELGERKAALDRACAELGRDPSSLGYSVMTACFVGESRDDVHERIARFLAVRGDDSDPAALARERSDRWLVGTVDEVAERIEGLRALGVTRVFLQHLNHGDDEMLALVGERLLQRPQVASRDVSTTELTGAEDVAWDLSDLYDGGDDPRIEQDIEQTEAAAAAFRERYYGKVAELSAEELRDAIEERERIESAFTRAIYYAHLWFSTDMADAPRGALVAKLTEKGAAIDTQLLFFGLELVALEDEQADALITSDALERWRHWLRSVRKFRPYVLTEPEEKILTEKAVSGFSAWDRLYDELLGAIRVDLDGAEIGFEEAMSKLYSADRDERRRASDAVTVSLGPGLRTRTFIFNTIAVDRSIDDRLRGYTTWISARNLSNDTTDEAVQALVDAVVGRYEVVQRYYTLKAKLLGLERLSFYDRMAPLADDPTQVGVGRGVRRSSWARSRTSPPRPATSSSSSSARAGSTHRRGKGSGPAPSARRTSRTCTRTCS